MITQYKNGLRKEGIKPPVVEAAPVKSSREYRRAWEGRLMARLGLDKYEHPCLLDDSLRPAGEVKIMLSQHIGAPASACVNVGDKVKAGDIVGMAGNGLSVNIHASIDGEVKDVTKDYIIIK
jgi:hypothetical protein